MALIRVVSGSRSIDAVPVTLLFVFICRQRQFGGGGELFARLVWKLRLTHEGGARRDASLLLLSRKRSKLTRTFLSSYVHNSRSHSRSRHHTHSSLVEIIREQSHSNFVKSQRDVIHRWAREKGLFHSIQRGGVCCGRLRSSYLLKNGPKVYLSEFLARHHQCNRRELFSIRFRVEDHQANGTELCSIAF